MEIAIWAITIILMLVGLAGTALPALPGSPLILLGAVIFGFADHFEHVTLTVILVLSGLTVATLVLDYLAATKGAKKYGASKLSVALTFVGVLVGIFSGLWGIVIFPLLGAVIGELIMGKDLRSSLRSGWGAFLGFLWGTFFKLVISIIMIVVFLFAAIE